MRATEIISISIAVIALIVSILSISLQYSVRDDLKFKITAPELVSLKPVNENPRTFVISFSLLVYNLGNRAAALEHLSLGLVKGNYEEHEKNPPTSCKEEQFGQILVPINRSTYSQGKVASVVIPKETIFTEEFVFDFFFHERAAPAVTAEGLVCLAASFSNSQGDDKRVSAPIAIIKVDLLRPDKIIANFRTDQFQQLEKLTDVF
jgi:hypothetical protein